MRQLLIGFIDALIPLGIAVSLLLFPQGFTKCDIAIEANKSVANRLKKTGWMLFAAGILVLIANIGKTVAKN